MQRTHLWIGGGLLFVTMIMAQTPTVGLLYSDTTRAWPGYTLFAPKASHFTYLIDNDGNLVHRWESAYAAGASAYFLENGTLLRAAKVPAGNQSGGFQVLDWDGTVLWEFAYGAQHHDIEPLPNGHVILVANDRKTAAEALAAGRRPELTGGTVRSLKLVEVAPTDSGSAIVWEWKAWDHLIQDTDSLKPNYGVVRDHPERIDVNFAYDASDDWLHPNSVDYNPDLDQLLVSNRGIHEVWVIDHSTTTEEAASSSGGLYGHGGDLLYRWGNPASYGAGDSTDQVFFGQHNAEWIPPGVPGEGHMLVFNNGFGRPDGAYSTVDEWIPPLDSAGTYGSALTAPYGPDSLVWRYQDTEGDTFYSPRFSSAQRLPNGNTLICSGADGRFLEVTPSGEIVWEYINPVTPDGPVAQGDSVYQNDVYRVDRIPLDHPGLAGHDLTPQGPIELYLSVAGEGGGPESYSLAAPYPNPFNPTTTIRFAVPYRGPVQITIYSLLGEEIATLQSGSVSPGWHTVSWNGKNSRQQPVPTGLYLIRLSSRETTLSRRVLLLK
ncbi:MAG: T9SS C-terminal target domain-containing protein [Candidatus Neomarinimicrobiota bacterium]|nr:MAG: T9SS C-terminal target domain-containing protein [Candidatus Neomarinimicrobiota bacterium]